MDRHGLSAAEAAERIALESDISALAARLQASGSAEYGGMWIEHEPVYKVTLAFTREADRKALTDSIDSKLRRYVQFKTVRSSVAQREAEIDRVIAALAPLNLEYSSFYEHRNDSLIIEADEDRAVQIIRRAIPQDLQNFIQVRKGNVPKKIQATGVRAGDGVYSGWWYYDSTAGGLHECSFAFNVTDNQNRAMILSAAHCQPETYIYYTDHWVSLAAPTIRFLTGKYDYRAQFTSPLATGPWVYYDNGKISYTGYTSRSNAVLGYPASGYFKVTGTRGYYDQVVGQVICKSGRSSGLSCGKITHGYYTLNGAKGWIESGESAQYIYATFGDSGSGVFSAPTSTGSVLAVGISANATVYDPTPASPSSGDERPCTSDDEAAGRISDCRLIHMPIDYIDDQQLLTVVTGS